MDKAVVLRAAHEGVHETLACEGMVEEQEVERYQIRGTSHK